MSGANGLERARRLTIEPLEDLFWKIRRGLRAGRRRLFPVVHCDVGGTTIALHLGSAQEHFRADTYATKEPETIRWLRERLRDDDVLYDVGANIGLYSLFAAKLRPACRVFAFEPESHNFSSLCRNVLLNRLENVTPCAFPLSDREGFELLHVYGLEPGAALHSLGSPSPLRDEAATIREGVLTTTLDVLVARAALPPPSLLKLDVDGIEEKILAGAGATLGSARLRSILVEATEPGAEGSSWAERMLAPFGYRLVERSDWSTEIQGLVSRNLIFDR